MHLPSVFVIQQEGADEMESVQRAVVAQQETIWLVSLVLGEGIVCGSSGGGARLGVTTLLKLVDYWVLSILTMSVLQARCEGKLGQLN